MASQPLPCYPAPRRFAPLAGVAALLLVVSSLGVATLAAAATPYQPPELTDPAVQSATLAVAMKYANVVPGVDAKTLRWFLYAIEHRESTFRAGSCNYNDGAGSWNQPLAWFWPTSDHLPHGCGLTQVTGWVHEGVPFPGNAATAPSLLTKGVYGTVVPPAAITSLSTPFDATQNLERFVTEEVLPDYVAIHARYPTYNVDQTLRAVAFHWNKGEYVAYNPSDCSYLCLYDQYVSVYKPAVLADAAWPSSATTTISPAPAPAPGPTPAAAASSTSVSFTLSPNVNQWWIETYVSPTASAVSASVNGGPQLRMTHESWGAWGLGATAPAGSSVAFTATVNGASVTSPTYAWLSSAAPTPAPAPAPAPVLAPAPAPASTASASFTLSPNVNAWWIEAKVASNAGAVTAVSASVNGGAPIPLVKTSWGSWAKSSYVPHGATVVLTATIGASTVTSSAYSWP